MRADFLERVRRYSFLITLGIVVYGAYMFLPPNQSTYATLQMGGHRGIYNSAWVGAVVAVMGTIYLALIGFYLVKNAIRRDRITGVGEIIAATPTWKVSYTLGKALSNLAVLVAMVAVLAIAAGIMQLVRGESYHLGVWNLISPFLFLSFPVLVVIAGAAAFFESVPVLRGGIGNVVWYGLWTAALATEMEAGSTLLGHRIIVPKMQAGCVAAFADYSIEDGYSSGFITKSDGGIFDLTTFEWGGMDWTQEILIARLLLIGLGIGVAVIAAVFFDRFDSAEPAQERSVSRAPAALKGLMPRWLRREEPAFAGIAAATAADVHLGSLTAVERGSRFRLPGLIRAELRLLLYRHGFWWKVIALGLIVAGLFVPMNIGQRILWPAALIWPLLLWSSMGTRGVEDRTGQLVFSAPRPLLRQLPAAWLAGVSVTAVVSAGMGLRLLIAGDGSGIFAWLIGVLFIPSLALACGVWSGSGKIFEVLYVMLWYAGPISCAAPADYMGVTEEGIAAGVPVYYLVITVALLALAWLGRWWRSRQ